MAHSQFADLSRRERQIMDILYEKSECSAQDVLERLPNPPGYSAVRALIARLVDKKFVIFRNEGGKYIYSPAVAENTAQLTAITRLLRTFFKGSKVQAVNALLDAEGEKLSSREIEELERTIARVKLAQERSTQIQSSQGKRAE